MWVVSFMVLILSPIVRHFAFRDKAHPNLTQYLPKLHKLNNILIAEQTPKAKAPDILDYPHGIAGKERNRVHGILDRCYFAHVGDTVTSTSTGTVFTNLPMPRIILPFNQSATSSASAKSHSTITSSCTTSTGCAVGNFARSFQDS